MYKVTKASIVKDGKPVKEYNLDVETEDLESTREYAKRLYTEECLLGLEVDLQYKQFNK